MTASGRIDGWKAIGAHFGRDRTTAIRWAQNRGLPVRRMPGGKKATVYALREELDRWAQGQGALDEAADSELPPVPPTVAPSRRGLWIAALLLGVLLIGVLILLRPGEAKAPALPSDPEAARLYLQARDDWAQREPASLTRAIAALHEAARREPSFAPAHSGLADAYLLAREFGALDDTTAFARARASAHAALRIDRDQAGAHRALGFILYWRDHDGQAAGRAFRRARTLAPNDAQTHFWYGNILADNGDHAAAMRELNAARLIEPGSVAIQTDLGWALWSAGNGDEAARILSGLRIRHPDFAVVRDCLATIHLAGGDLAGYSNELLAYARLRDEKALIAHAAALLASLPDGPVATYAVLAEQARADLAANPGRNHVWAAFVASASGDRAALRAILRAAERRQERWGSAGIVSRMAQRWGADAEISTLIARRRAPPIE